MPLAQPADDYSVLHDLTRRRLPKPFLDPRRLQLPHLQVAVHRLIQQIAPVAVILLGVSVQLLHLPIVDANTYGPRSRHNTTYDNIGYVYRYEVRQVSFIHEECERDLTAEPAATWIKEGRLIVTPGNSTNIGEIERVIVEWTAKYGVMEWGADPTQAMYLLTRLQDVHEIFCGQFPQNYNQYTEALKTLTKQVIPGHHLLHDGDPLLSWAWCNLAIKEGPKQLIMPDKDNSADKIDPAVATIMAFKLAYLEVDDNSVFKMGDSAFL